MNSHLKSIQDNLNNHELSIERRISNMFMPMGFVAGVLGWIICVFAGVSRWGLFTVGFIVALIPIVMIICYLLGKAEYGRYYIVGAVILAIPTIWITSGGINSGVSIWFVYEMFFICLALKKKTLRNFIVLATILDSLCFIINYHYPELIYSLQDKHSLYVSTYGSVIIVSAAIIITVMLQKSIYNNERIKLLKVNEYQKNFLSNFSHELRTPINVIIGMNEMIKRTDNVDDIMQYTENINVAGDALLSLVNDILDFTKMETGELILNNEEYDVEKLLTKAFTLSTINAGDKGIDFRVKLNSNLPCRLLGDGERIRQVITKLVENAVEFTDSGFVEVRISFEKDNDDNRIRIEVEDSGRGIAGSKLNEIFDEFKRIETSDSKAFCNSGLGLSITKFIVEKMGGTISVDSEVSKGTTFIVMIPQEVIDETPIKDYDAFEIRSDAKYEEYFKAPDARILVVDDIELNIMVFTGLLKRTQIQIDSALSGKEALELISRNKYDMVFLDHMMPEMDGVETYNEIRKTDKKTPVIVLTANAIAGAKEEYLSLGFAEYLSKPIEFEKLEKIIEKYLPAEKIQKDYGKAEVVSGSSKQKSFISELPKVDGIEWKYAVIHIPEKELLMNSVKNLYNTLKTDSEKIKGYVSELTRTCEADEGEGREIFEATLDVYRITVHSLKSTNAMIGSTLVSSLAKVAEFAAKDRDINTIKSITPILIKEMLALRNRLLEAFGFDEGKTEIDINDPLIISYLKDLKSFAEAFDVESMDILMNELDKYRFKDEGSDILEKLKAAVADLDTDTIIKTVNDLINA